MFQEINKSLLINLNKLGEYEIVENIVYLFADLPIFLLPIFLVSMWLYYSKKKLHNEKHKLLFIFYSTIIGIIISLIIQQFVNIDRPESALENSGKLLLSHIPDASFPSDHATVSFAFLFSLFFNGFKRFGLLFLVLAILMNLSRVIAGVHWPFDIIAGILVGLLGAIISNRFLNKQKLVIRVNDFIINILKKIKL